jgi:hypothetical protein
LPIAEASRPSSTFERVDFATIIAIVTVELINDGAREAVGTTGSEKSQPCKVLVAFGREPPEGIVTEGTKGHSSGRGTGKPFSRGVRTRN